MTQSRVGDRYACRKLLWKCRRGSRTTCTVLVPDDAIGRHRRIPRSTAAQTPSVRAPKRAYRPHKSGCLHISISSGATLALCKWPPRPLPTHSKQRQELKSPSCSGTVPPWPEFHRPPKDAAMTDGGNKGVRSLCLKVSRAGWRNAECVVKNPSHSTLGRGRCFLVQPAGGSDMTW